LAGEEQSSDDPAPEPAGTIDHFAIEIERFNKDSVIQDLKQRGTPREEGDAGLHVKDPDGFSVQGASPSSSTRRA